MGTVTDIKKGIDEDQKCELSVRVVAILMSMAEGRGKGIIAVHTSQAFAVATYKSHLTAVAAAMELGPTLDDQFKKMCEACEDLQ